MFQEAPSLRYDVEQTTAANEGGFGILAKMEKLEDRIKRVESDYQKLESHRQSYLDLRQRAVSTWVRDAFGKDTKRRKEEIRRLNKAIL